MSKKATIVLALLVAALGGYIALFERGSLTSKELDARQGKVLTTFVRDKIDRLELTRGGKKLVLERSPLEDGWADWKMTAPVKVAADQQAVDGVLGELEWLSARRTLQNISAEDKKSFGLADAKLVVRFRVAKQEHTLRIGNTDVHGESHYAVRDDETTAYLVPKTIVEALDHDAGHFRSKQILGDITAAWAQRLELHTQAGAQLLQKESDRWWYATGLKTLADEQRINMLINQLDTLRAERYLEGAEKQAAQQALAQGSTVELRVMPDQHREDKAPERFLLRFAGACLGHEGERYAQAGDGDDPVCVAADMLRVLEATENELRLTRLFGVDSSEVERIALKAGSESMVLRRSGENWLRDAGAAPDRESVEAWLADLGSLRAGAPAPLRTLREDASINLALASEKQLVLHAHFDEAAQHTLVWRDGENVLWTFGWELAERLQPSPKRFGSLEPWASKQPSQVTWVDARTGTLRRSLSLREGAWHTDKAKLADDDNARVREAVRELIKLHLLANVTERARPVHGLDAPRAQVSLRLTGEAQPLELTLGALTARGSYARLGGLVVEVGAELERAITQLAGGTVSAPEAGAAVEEEHDEPSDEHDHEAEHVH